MPRCDLCETELGEGWCSTCCAEADERAKETRRCPSCVGKGVVDYGYTCLQCGGSGKVDADGFAVLD